MALYRHTEYLHQGSTSDEWEKSYSPGQTTAWSGIYRCKACGHEIVHTIDKSLPPQNHHVHPEGMGPIRWQLIVTDYTRK